MSQTSRNQCFSFYICLMIEGSGSIPLTDGSGSGRPKNTWIRIRNTGFLIWLFDDPPDPDSGVRFWSVFDLAFWESAGSRFSSNPGLWHRQPRCGFDPLFIWLFWDSDVDSVIMKMTKRKVNLIISVADPYRLYADPDSTYHPDAYLGANPESVFYFMRIRIFIWC